MTPHPRSLTFVPREIPALQLGFRNLEEGRGILRGGPFLRHGEGEVRVGDPTVRFGAIDWGMDLEADVEVLAGKKVDPFDRSDVRYSRTTTSSNDGNILIRWKDTSKGGTSAKPLEGLGDCRRR